MPPGFHQVDGCAEKDFAKSCDLAVSVESYQKHNDLLVDIWTPIFQGFDKAEHAGKRLGVIAGRNDLETAL